MSKQKHPPQQTLTVPLDDVELLVTFYVNYDRPRDEAPEVYDISYTLAPCEWLERAVHEALIDRVWEAEIKEATELFINRSER